MSEQWPVRILVLDRGFVQACRCPDPQQYALWLPYTHGRTIRRWGTSQGLAELCDGPLAETVLDNLEPAGNVPVRAVLKVLELTETGAERWAEALREAPRASTGRRASRS